MSLFLLPSLDVYVGCLQGSDLDYFNGSCNGFISTGDKIWGEIGWQSYDAILCSHIVKKKVLSGVCFLLSGDSGLVSFQTYTF